MTSTTIGTTIHDETVTVEAIGSSHAVMLDGRKLGDLHLNREAAMARALDLVPEHRRYVAPTHHQVSDKTTLHVAGVRWGRQMIGVAPEGGRHVYQGPVDPEPFAFTFALAGVIDQHGGSRADDERTGWVDCRPGDTFEVEGIPGTWELRAPGRMDGDNCKLVKVEGAAVEAAAAPAAKPTAYLLVQRLAKALREDELVQAHGAEDIVVWSGADHARFTGWDTKAPAICWEGGPYEWAVGLVDSDGARIGTEHGSEPNVAQPVRDAYTAIREAGFYCELTNSFVLAVYPA